MESIKTNAPTTPFGKTDKAKHAQEVEAIAAFQTMDNAMQALSGGPDTHVLSKQVIESAGAGLLGVSQDALNKAIDATGAESFDMAHFTALVAGLTPTDAGQAGPAGKVLERGGHNDPDAVKALQTALQKQGLYNGKIDGVYGKGTEDAVKDFQRRVGHVDANGNPDGKAGPITQAALDMENNAALQLGNVNQREDQATDQVVTAPTTTQQTASDSDTLMDAAKQALAQNDGADDATKVQSVVDALNNTPVTGDKAAALNDVLSRLPGGDDLTKGVAEAQMQTLMAQYPPDKVKQMQADNNASENVQLQELQKKALLAWSRSGDSTSTAKQQTTDFLTNLGTFGAPPNQETAPTTPTTPVNNGSGAPDDANQAPLTPAPPQDSLAGQATADARALQQAMQQTIDNTPQPVDRAKLITALQQQLGNATTTGDKLEALTAMLGSLQKGTPEAQAAALAVIDTVRDNFDMDRLAQMQTDPAQQGQYRRLGEMVRMAKDKFDENDDAVDSLYRNGPRDWDHQLNIFNTL